MGSPFGGRHIVVPNGGPCAALAVLRDARNLGCTCTRSPGTPRVARPGSHRLSHCSLCVCRVRGTGTGKEVPMGITKTLLLTLCRTTVL